MFSEFLTPSRGLAVLIWVMAETTFLDKPILGKCGKGESKILD
jgi:hypothetical protein